MPYSFWIMVPPQYFKECVGVKTSHFPKLNCCRRLLTASWKTLSVGHPVTKTSSTCKIIIPRKLPWLECLSFATNMKQHWSMGCLIHPISVSRLLASWYQSNGASERPYALSFSLMKTCFEIPSRFTPSKGPQSAGRRTMMTLSKLLPDRKAAFTSAQISCQLFHFVKVNNHSLACLDAVGEALLSVITSGSS